MTSPESDTAIGAVVERARGGDREAFGALYERLAPALHAWAAVRIHPRHRGRLDPSDLVQDVWWRAIDSFASFDPARGSFRSWLFRIATNAMTDALRRLSVRGQIAAFDRAARQQSLPSDMVAQVTSISVKAARDEAVVRLVELATSLGPEDRALLALCGIEGLSAVEAAKILATGSEAASKRWQRLRSRLRASPAWQSVLSMTEA